MIINEINFILENLRIKAYVEATFNYLALLHIIIGGWALTLLEIICMSG
jgi:hypothetical protein